LTDKVLDIKLLPTIRDELTIGITDICFDLSIDHLHQQEQDELLTGNVTERRKAELMTGRVLQKELARLNKLNPGQFYIKKDKLGKPIGYHEKAKCGVAISHTKSMIAGALNLKGEVGLDIEQKNRNVHKDIRNRILTAEEHDSLKTYDTIQIWTIKESILKLLGSGLRISMRSIQVKPIDKERFQSIVSERPILIYSYNMEKIWLTISLFDD